MSQVCVNYHRNKPDGRTPRELPAVDKWRAARQCLPHIDRNWAHRPRGGANARVTQINISTPANTPAFGGQSFGAGKYQMINGTIKGEVDPKDPLNAVIVDIDL